MKNLRKLYLETVDDLDALEIPYRRVKAVTVNKRAKSRWGQCRKTHDDKGLCFEIQINAELLKDELDDMAAKNTIAHELIHTVEGCMNHGPKWQAWGRKLDVFGYNIQRTTSAEEKGIAADSLAGYKYIITCNGCGSIARYTRKSKVVTKLMAGSSDCYCGKCKCRNFTVKTVA